MMKKIYVLLSAMLFGAGTFAQGDNCATAVPVTPGTYTADGPSTGGGAIGSGTTGTNADWYSFTPTCNGTIDIASCDGGTDTKVYLFDASAGCAAIAGGEITNNDDACQMGPGLSNYASQINGANVTAGTTYLIEWTDRWSGNGFDWSLTFNISGFPNVATSNITFDGADVSWDPAGTETSWVVEYGVAGFTQGAGTQITVNTTSATTLSGLNPETSYDVYISSPSSPCAYVSMTSFTTTAVCPVPTGISATPGAVDAVLNWTAGGSEVLWNVEYGNFGFVLGSGTQDNALATNSDNLSGLTTLTDYQWYVQAVCDLNTTDGVDTVSYWVGPDAFTTTATCPQPSGLGATVNSFQDADLSWTAGALETSWNIEYGATGFLLGSGTATTSSATTLNVTGLTEGTTYDYYVAADCGAGDVSVWVGPFTFTTPLACPEVTGVFATPGALDAVIDWTAGGSETEWNVEYGAPGFTQGSGTTVNVLTTPQATLTGLTADTDYEYYVEAVCGGANGNSIFLGPFTFTTGSTCPVPSALGIANLNPNDVDFTWTAGGVETDWEIEYGMNGFTQGSGTLMSTTTNPTNITGLTADTDYCYYLRAVCGAGDNSMWVGPFCFTTTSSCIQPSALGVSGLTTTSADFNWTVGLAETEWNVEYGTGGFTPGSGTLVNVTGGTPTTNVTGLTPATTYDFYVQAVCGAGDESLWVGPFQFTTAISCPQPTNLNVMNVTTTAANLIFQAGGAETEWAIEWGTPGFMPSTGTSFGNVMTTTSNPYYAEMMNPSSSYEYYVQAVCGVGDSSVWAGPFLFNTLLSNDLPCDAIDLPVDGSVNVYNNIGATENGENAITPASGPVDGTMTWGDDAIADGPVWFSFKAPTSGNVIVSTANDATTNAGSRTEIAVYETGDCNTFGNYNLLGANGDLVSGNNGSEVALCGLTPSETYYVMVDGYSFVDLFSTTVAFQGDFGISITDTPTADAGTATSGNICVVPGDAVNMFDGITGWSDGNGTWYYPNATDPGAQAFTAVNDTLLLTGLTPGTPFTFDYVVLGGCNNDTVSTTITTGDQPSAGGDGTLTDCNTGDVFLMEGLTGTVLTGGMWSSADATADAAINGNTFEANGVTGGTDYTFDYVVTDGGFCSDTASVVVTLDDCLGIEENNNASLEVYPNPVQDVLTIANLNVVGTAVITLVDVQGKIVYTKNISDLTGNFQLDLSDFENGVYIVEITSESNTQKVRVVKH